MLLKTVALLFFAIELVCSAPNTEPTQNYEHQLLKDIMDAVTELLKGPKKLLDMMVPKGFDKYECCSKGPEQFCIAERILSVLNSTQNGIPGNKWKIDRVLKQYNTYHLTATNCTVTTNEDEEQLRVLLKDLGCCAQDKYSRRNHNRAQRSANNRTKNITFCINQR